MVELRLLLAAAVLVAFVAGCRRVEAIGPALRPGAFVGVVGMYEQARLASSTTVADG